MLRRKTVKGISLTFICVVGFLYVCKGNEEDVQPLLESTIEYTVHEVNDTTYTAVSEQTDNRGHYEGLEFTPQQAGKRLSVGDKVTGYWHGSRLYAVVPK